MDEPLIFERSRRGRKGYSLPEEKLKTKPQDVIPDRLLRQDIKDFPEVSELDVVRHFTHLSQRNYGVDTGFYPLGSCTMKYNPKINEEAARLRGFALSHPCQPEELSQGVLRLIFELSQFLAEIGGLDAVSLQPAAGAQGEFTGMRVIRAYHEKKGNPRAAVLIPDTAHGTNPASSRLCGYGVIQVKTTEKGVLAPEAVSQAMTEDIAGLMLTNPNTLGLFETNIKEVAEVVHSKGGLVYCDGANMNALMGIARPGDMGVDVLQFNLHKTFSTPHGGGGPGSGPVAVKKHLRRFLPVPLVVKKGTKYVLDYKLPDSIGKVKAFYGNFGVMVRAYAYIRSMGASGLKRASECAVLNARYLRERLLPYFDLPYDSPCLHECVFSDNKQKEKGVTTLDMAKRLMDYGFHPPTIYFPLVVQGALMIEPTETESRETLDEFVEAMIAIAKEAQENPEIILSAPHRTKVSRVDEVKAARELILKWKP